MEAAAAEEQAVTGVAHEVAALILVASIHKPTLRALAYATEGDLGYIIGGFALQPGGPRCPESCA